MKLPEQIKTWLPLALITATAGSLGYFATQIVESAAAPFWQHVAPSIPQKLLLSLCSFLLLVVAILAAWVVYLHRVHRESSLADVNKQFEEQFGEFVANPGVWRHKTKAGVFCPNCKAQGRVSPMSEFEQGWQCPVQGCKYYAYKPGFPKLPPSGASPYIDLGGL